LGGRIPLMLYDPETELLPDDSRKGYFFTNYIDLPWMARECI